MSEAQVPPAVEMPATDNTAPVMVAPAGTFTAPVNDSVPLAVKANEVPKVVVTVCVPPKGGPNAVTFSVEAFKHAEPPVTAVGAATGNSIEEVPKSTEHAG